MSRHFACPVCSHVHGSWSPRCLRCNAHGLTLTSAIPSPEPESEPESESEPEAEAEPNKRTFAATEDEAPIPIRPRLMIARDRTPDPELTDPAEELADVLDGDGPIPITDVSESSFVRTSTGLPPLDHVLGGGLVEGSVVLLASPRGIGKSSLSLQMLAGLADQQTLYVTGEETVAQVAATARRINAATPNLSVYVERNPAKVFAHARKMRAQTIVIDSIQKMVCDDVNGRAGSPAQVKECTARFVDFAKSTNTVLWIIGHVTGDGAIAGPTTIEHDVDVVLELTAGLKLEGNERIIRCLGKNRFGPSNLVGSFELTGTGLRPVDADGWDEPL